MIGKRPDGNSNETAKEFNRTIAEQRRKIREKRFCKELTKKQQESIIDGQGIDGATISDWFWKWKRDDLERLSSLAKRASVERMSLAEITRAAKGSIENNYSDGVFTESKVSAARMARTIVNGVSNNARVETIVQNSDVIDGVKFVGTLDGKTCPYCASYDGYIWRGEEIAEARRPPIHPNCRCCLIPYVELKDEEGNVVDVDGERPAANADFDKLAQDAYNEHAREKGWKRRWDDLSPSTRLKYYYQAQKDYEAETGKPAYRQVSGATTFQEYFHRQPDSFKRAWLGAKRYELYKSGKLKEKNIFKPDLTYQVSVESLVRDDGRSIARFKNNKRKDRQDEIILNEPPISDEHYISKEPSLDGSNNVHELYSYWETLSLKELAEVENRIKEHFTAWHSYINSKRPKQEDYSSIKLYEQDEQLWKQDKKDGNVFWRDIIYAFRSAKEEAKNRQEAEKFKNPFDSIMEPGDYQNNPETRKELERIENRYINDKKLHGDKEASRRKNDALLNLILPSMPTDETIEALKKKMPKNGFIPAKDVSFSQKEFNEIKDTFVEETERGLTYIARILENLGRSYKDIFPLQIDEEVRERGGVLDIQ